MVDKPPLPIRPTHELFARMQRLPRPSGPLLRLPPFPALPCPAPCLPLARPPRPRRPRGDWAARHP
eukprot:940773-Pyramimonas_sp.AAC.1